jgi:hypothetical protein
MADESPADSSAPLTGAAAIDLTFDSIGVPRLSLLQPDLSARLRDILQLRVPRLPPLLPNWEPGQWLDEPARIALEEGIPMAYVPSSELVAQLVTLDSREDRLALIEA